MSPIVIKEGLRERAGTGDSRTVRLGEGELYGDSECLKIARKDLATVRSGIGYSE